MTAPAGDRPVTVVTSRRVRLGREAEFEVWLAGIGRAAARLPGLVGRRVVRPRRAAAAIASAVRDDPETRTSFETDTQHDFPEYVIVFEFDSYAHLRAWTESAERRRWLAGVASLVEDEFKETVLTSLEQWFTLPGQPSLPPPARTKMATLTLLAIYPLSYGLNAILGGLFAPLPAPLRSLVLSVVLIGLMTWVVMPRVTRLFRRWLDPGIR